MQLSVIIPCFNAAATLATQLEAFLGQRWPQPWEVIIADNGSTDATCAIAQQYCARLPQLRIIDASARRGAAHARNQGVLAAQSRALAFCDADDEVAPGWVAAMGAALQDHEFVVAQIDIGRLNPPWIADIWQPSRSGPRPHLGFLPAAASFGIGVRRTLHERIGGFDEALLRLQDIDYSWRAQLAGARLHFVPEALVYYRCRHTLRSVLRQSYLDGKYRVLLYKRYASQGMPWKPWKIAMCAWLDLLKHTPRNHSKADWMRWCIEFGLRLGYIRGSIQYRVLAI